MATHCPPLGMAVVLAIMVASSCSTSSRPSDDPDSGDTDSDTVMVMVASDPMQLGSTSSCFGVDAALSDSHLAVSWTDLTVSANIAILPWLEPEQITIGSTPVPCSYSFMSSRLYWTESGILSLTFGIPFVSSDPTCDMAQSVFSAAGSLVDGPHKHYAPEGYGLAQAEGSETADGNDRVVVATLFSNSASDEPGDETVLFAVDRFGPGGFRETLVSEVYDWPEETETLISSLGIRNHPWSGTFEENGTVSAFTVNGSGGIVFARASVGGEVLDAPMVIAHAPEEDPGISQAAVKGASFARMGDAVLGVVQMIGDWGTFHTIHYSVLVDLEGEVLGGPNVLAPLESAEQDSGFHSTDLATWGERFAYCYFLADEPESASYRLAVLDHNGVLTSEPITLLSDAGLGTNPSCSIEVVDQATLVVVVAKHSGIPESSLSGPYLIVVTDPGLQ